MMGGEVYSQEHLSNLLTISEGKGSCNYFLIPNLTIHNSFSDEIGLGLLSKDENKFLRRGK